MVEREFPCEESTPRFQLKLRDSKRKHILDLLKLALRPSDANEHRAAHAILISDQSWTTLDSVLLVCLDSQEDVIGLIVKTSELPSIYAG